MLEPTKKSLGAVASNDFGTDEERAKAEGPSGGFLTVDADTEKPGILG